MLFHRYMLLVVGLGMFMVALAVVVNDAWLLLRYRRRIGKGAVALEPEPIRWRTTIALACVAWAPLVMAVGSTQLF
jgi:hypothetical protein